MPRARYTTLTLLYILVPSLRFVTQLRESELFYFDLHVRGQSGDLNRESWSGDRSKVDEV